MNWYWDVASNVRAFPSKFLKNLVFIISKINFITYNTPFYNISYIKTSIFLTLHLNILSLLFLFIFYYYFSLSLCLSLPLSLHLSQPSLEASPSLWYLLSKSQWPKISSSSPLTTATTTTTNHNHNLQPPKTKKKKIPMAQTKKLLPLSNICSQNLYCLSFSNSSPLTTTTATTTNHNLNPEPPK